MCPTVGDCPINGIGLRLVPPGMYIEIILATIATFVWWFVQPGLVQEICLKVMLVSSISTILFNGNPLFVSTAITF